MASTTGVAGDVIVFENEVVPKERFGAELRSLLERNTRMLLIYTGLGPLAYYYRKQICDAFPDLDLDQNVHVCFYPEADHTFTLPGNRRQVIADIENWLLAEFTTDRTPVEAHSPRGETPS